MVLGCVSQMNPKGELRMYEERESPKNGNSRLPTIYDLTPKLLGMVNFILRGPNRIKIYFQLLNDILTLQKN